MLQTIQNQTAIRGIERSQGGAVGTEQQLEQAVGVSLLADFNEQLADISSSMRQQLAEKQALRQEISTLQSFSSRTTEKTPQGEEAVSITDKEYSDLVNKYPGLQFQKKDGAGYFLKKDSLKNIVEGRQEKLAGLNSNTEMTMLHIQSLVDQRKNALMMLSNLISSRNETAMSIIRNLKN